MERERRIRLGISSCLLGERVRYDGGHKRDPFLAEVLGRYVEWVPVCPESELGLGVPREASRLERKDRTIHFVGIESRRDHTQHFRRWGDRRAGALALEGLSGYVWKSGSPSCGMLGVPVHELDGASKLSGKPNRKRSGKRDGRGLFVSMVAAAMPNLPLEEESRLREPERREHFVERVCAYHRLRSLFRGRWNRGKVIEFHHRNELSLMLHSARGARKLDKLVASIADLPRPAFRQQYETVFMSALGRFASKNRRLRFLEHLDRRLAGHLDSSSRNELRSAIEGFRGGQARWIRAMGLIGGHARRLGLAGLGGQDYFQPHPLEAMLRAHL